MGLRDMLRAVREYPALSAELESARSELRRTQQTLERSEQGRQSVSLALEEQEHYSNFLSKQALALRTALQKLCPPLSSLERKKQFYAVISSHLDLRGFTLYHIKDELDDLVNALRGDGPLKDLRAMERFCRDHAQARMSPQSGTEYFAFRADTPKHRYYLRFLPQRGNYNLYISHVTAFTGKENAIG